MAEAWRRQKTNQLWIWTHSASCSSYCTGTHDHLREQFSNFLVNKVLDAATVFECRSYWPENGDLETHGDSQEVKEIKEAFG